MLTHESNAMAEIIEFIVKTALNALVVFLISWAAAAGWHMVA